MQVCRRKLVFYLVRWDEKGMTQIPESDKGYKRPQKQYITR